MKGFKPLYILAAAMALLVAAGQATAGISTAPYVNGNIDFEDLGVAAGAQLQPGEGVGVVSRGFNYTPGPNNTSSYNDLHISNEDPVWSSNGSVVGGAHDDVVLTRVGGGTFDLFNFSYAGYPDATPGDGFGWEDSLIVTGTLLGGGFVSQTFVWGVDIDGQVDGIGGVTDFQTFFFSQEVWYDLTSVTFDYGPFNPRNTYFGLFALDNIEVGYSVVPEPSTWLLFGIGLLGLLITTRKRLS